MVKVVTSTFKQILRVAGFASMMAIVALVSTERSAQAQSTDNDLLRHRTWVDRTPGVSLVALASWTDCNFIGNHESNTRSVTEEPVGSRL